MREDGIPPGGIRVVLNQPPALLISWVNEGSPGGNRVHSTMR